MHRSPLLADVTELARILNRDRSQRPSGYMNQPRLQRAYLAYYLPRQYTLFCQLISRFQSEQLHNFMPREVLDLGAGPLSASSALATCFQSIESIDAVDFSMSMMKHGQKILETLLFAQKRNVKMRLLAQDFRRLRFSASYDLIFLGHVLNEHPHLYDGEHLIEWLQKLLRHLHDDGLIIITEPANKEPSRALQRLRDMIIKSDLADVIAPCPAVHCCPLLERQSDWCFSEYHNTHHPALLKLSQQLSFQDKIIKSSYLIVTHKSFQRGLSRLVGGFMQDEKSVMRRYVCTDIGRQIVSGEPKLPIELRTRLRGEIITEDELKNYASAANQSITQTWQTAEQAKKQKNPLRKSSSKRETKGKSPKAKI
jgi:ribosomal protein RSM22 (predicted rRNA methylase)